MEAFEGSKDVFKSLGEKAKKYGKIAFKSAKKAAGLHVGQVTEANPMYFIVVAFQGAMVRKGIELDSPTVHGLRRGDLVTCVDISGRRARIIEPVEGWVSIKTQDNEPILEMTIAPDKSTQVSQMEKRFEKLKAEQQTNRSSLDEDRVIPAPGQAEALPDAQVKESDAATVNTIKTKLSFKPTHPHHSTNSTEKSSIPKLSGPGGIKRPPTANVPDLFTFDSPKSNEKAASVHLIDEPVVRDTLTSAPVVRQDPFADLLAADHVAPMQAAPVLSFPASSPDLIDQQSRRTQERPRDKQTKGDFDDWFQ